MRVGWRQRLPELPCQPSRSRQWSIDQQRSGRIAFKSAAHMAMAEASCSTLRKKPKIETHDERQRRVIRGAEQRMTH